MYIQRYAQDVVESMNRTFKIVYLGGPRQVGKTTLLLHMAEKQGRGYVSLDDIAIRRLAKEDPALFIQAYPPPVIIDEVQYAPELFPYLKLAVDQSNKNGQYWLTGSQQFSLIRHIQESLAGRVGIISMLGLSLAEEYAYTKKIKPFTPGQKKEKQAKNWNIKNIFERIKRGSFPVLAAKNSPSSDAFYSSYIQTYVDRDIRTLFGVEKTREFHIFLQLCAARTGQILNISELARDAGVSVHAAQSWISILESSMQIFLLQPYFGNISKRSIKSPKMYFHDTGLAAYLAKWTSPSALSQGNMAGAFFETLAIGEIVKSYWYRGKEAPVYYVRDKEGHEIDMLIEQDANLYPVEIKLAATLQPSQEKNITYFGARAKNIKTAGIIYLGKDHLPLSSVTTGIPIGEIS